MNMYKGKIDQSIIMQCSLATIISILCLSQNVHSFVPNIQTYTQSLYNNVLTKGMCGSTKAQKKIAFLGNHRAFQSLIPLAKKSSDISDEYEEEFELEYEEEEYEGDEEEGENEDEWEYEYEEVEDEDGIEDEDEKKSIDDDIVEYDVPLQDDLDDPNYMAQKALIEQTINERTALHELKEKVESSDAPEFLRDNIEQFLNQQLEEANIDLSEVDKHLASMDISEEEATVSINEEMERTQHMSSSEKSQYILQNLASGPDAFPSDDDPIYKVGEDGEGFGVKNEDLVRLQNSLEDLVGTIEGYTDGSMIDNKQAMIRPNHELDQLDPQTLDEINMCLNASAANANGLEYGETIKNEDPIRWLLYDLDFNVTNLMLASCKHNPEAPLILNHWMPQLCAYSRYADTREREFQFTWDDCDSADMDELLRYYQGLGHDKIPTFTPKETNIVEVSDEFDQEYITMSAFENWMDEVYDDEFEDLYFDDEDFQPEHNVFDFDFGKGDSETVSAFKTEYEDFSKEHSNETQAWKDQYAKQTNYTLVEDKEGAEAFRGHLVIACCGSDHDLELAEKITLRMTEEFGKKVYVETRVYNHARQEDNVYEIWLESYDIQLIHSRRGAFYNSKQWGGPADVDDTQLEFVVDKVRHSISDDSRYSYHIHEFFSEV
mmetsp:Transcript_28815/g.33109  ORF Transcript_28815/g.33109 Transcript_28815/m.33109 type:complete len:661 (-) Transcript_28815:74-2056(-)